MKSQLLSILFLAFLTVCSLGQPFAVSAADSTGFNPFSVSVSAESPDETPIGTVISCPFAKCKGEEAITGEGYPKWLECNGQVINATTYPELSALVGGRVPDLRGLFLRGFGSQSHIKNNGTTVGNTATLHSSGSLGVIQGDATRNITGTAPLCDTNASFDHTFSGPYICSGSYGHRGSSSQDNDNQINYFDSGRVVPTANENRPANMAVRYLIRAAK